MTGLFTGFFLMAPFLGAVGVGAPATNAVPMCNGVPATIVGDDVAGSGPYRQGPGTLGPGPVPP